MHSTRKEAAAAGEKYYFTGLPCPRGHIVERTVKKAECTSCRRAQRRAQEHRKKKLRPGYKVAHSRRTRKQRAAPGYREWYRAWKKEWRRQNPDKERAIRSKPISRIKCHLRGRIRELVVLGRAARGLSKSKLVGCTAPELTAHLEAQFVSGMTWDNYGKWHIDHIRPLASFNLLDVDELSTSCHYTNLQPLWAEDNLKKSSH